MAEEQEALADLRARVERIERQLAGSGPDGGGAAPPPAQEAGTWWLLEELHRRDPVPAVAFGGTARDADGEPVFRVVPGTAGTCRRGATRALYPGDNAGRSR